MSINSKRISTLRTIQCCLLLLFSFSFLGSLARNSEAAIPSLIYEKTWNIDHGARDVAISGDGNYFVTKEDVTGNVTLFSRQDNTILWSYYNAVNYTSVVAISDNGSYVYAVGTGFCAVLHNSSSTPERMWFYTVQEIVRGIAVSRDGSYCAIITYENTNFRGSIYVLNRNNASIQWQYTFGVDYSYFSDVAISRNGSLIVAGGSVGTYVYGPVSATPLWTRAGNCQRVAISADASTIFSYGNDGFHLFGNASSTPVWTNATTGVTGVDEIAISANGSRMMAACTPNSTLLFYNSSGQVVKTTPMSGTPRYLDLTDDGEKYCVTILSRNASFFEISSDFPAWSKITTQNITKCCISNDGNFMVVGNANWFYPGFVEIIEFKDSDHDGISDTYETTTTGTNPNSPDSDADDLGDLEELTSGSDGYVTNPNLLDTDADGLNDSEEVTLGVDSYLTNPTLPDSDSDGLTDFWEWKNASDPGDTDTDNDLLSDGEEANTYHTNVTSSDTDDDGIDDYGEIHTYLTSPIEADSDTDGLKDGEEVFTYGTDPIDPDSDDDQLIDGWEISHGTDPKNETGDLDKDGLTDAEEVLTYYTVYSDSDTDDDQLSDGLEVHTYHTDPKKWDSDGDTFSDSEEIQKGTDPNDPNSHPTEENSDDLPDDLGGIFFVGILLLGTVFISIIVVIIRKKMTTKII